MSKRRVILLLAIAYVATFARTTESSSDEDGVKFAKLRKPGLSTKKVAKLLESIELPTKFKIGRLTVLDIRTKLDSTGSSVRHCQDASLAQRQEHIEELKSVISVYNYARDRYTQLLKYCTKKFKLVMEGNRQLEKVNVKGLEGEQIGGILLTISDKNNVKIGQVSVQEILNMASRWNDQPKDLCEREQILRYLRTSSGSSDLNMVSNVYRFLFARSTELASHCVENVERVYRDNQLVDKLYDESLTIEEVKNILNSIEDKENVKLGKFSVRIILDWDSGSKSMNDCQYDAFFEHFDFKNHLWRYQVWGLRKLATAQYKQLVSFCAADIRQVFDNSIGMLRGISKKDLDNMANRISSEYRYNIMEASRVVVDACPEITKSFDLVSAICDDSRYYFTTTPPGCVDILIWGKWTDINTICWQFINLWIEKKEQL